ncbi:MAG: iron-containing alcohol dehydrogenase, partial [Erysipelotrichaceae bacterium]|nr:iron-containing alcohol dehydrogenase [Erysipelotrichaceae bacterium]
FDFNRKTVKNYPSIIIPVGVILTISAAGSELSSSCVISNDELTPFIKQGFNDDNNRPLFAVCDPTLTYSVDKFQTGCGIVDIMMHTLERFMNANDNCMLSEQFAIGLLKTVMHYGKIAIDNPNDYEARAELMLASSFSHNGLTGLGKSQLMRVHGLEHVLSGCYDEVAHGAGLAILFPAWCIRVLSHPLANKQLTILAKELFNEDDPLKGIYALKNYFKQIYMPTSLSELKLNSKLDIEKMALIYSNNKTKVVHDFIDLDYQTVKEIFEMAR